MPSSQSNPLPALRESMGVSRVARITSLDRVGVEVASAIRPGGHVLQVCNGKGQSWEDAERGALFETAELHAAEHVSSSNLRYACARELRERSEHLWGPQALGSAGWFAAPELWSEELVIAWVRARVLSMGAEETPGVSGGGVRSRASAGVARDRRSGLAALTDRSDPQPGSYVWVPAQAVHSPPQGSVDLGPVFWAWASNGMGAHPDAEAATRHALLEAAERDQLAHMLPHGWTTDVLLSRRLTRSSLQKRAPSTHALVESISERGFEIALFDLTPPPQSPGALGLPVAGALLLDLEPSPVPLTAGYACRLDRDAALSSALLEAAQSRLTDIHGAREDVRAMPSDDVELVRNLLRSAGAMRDVQAMPSVRSDRALEKIGPAALVELEGPIADVHVARVIVPSFTVSELLV